MQAKDYPLVISKEQKAIHAVTGYAIHNFSKL